MSDEIIGLHQWFESAPGRYLLEWEQAHLDDAVANVFGYHALQVGMPWLQGLRANRMTHRWLALGTEYLAQPVQQPALWADPVALPFPANSLDLVLLPHALEHSPDPRSGMQYRVRIGQVTTHLAHPQRRQFRRMPALETHHLVAALAQAAAQGQPQESAAAGDQDLHRSRALMCGP